MEGVKMYCSHCGAGIDKDDKFCKKCGKENSSEKKPVPAPANEGKSGCNKGCTWASLVTLLIIFLIILFSYFDTIKSSTSLKYGFILIGVLFILFLGWVIFVSVKKRGTKEDAKKTNPKTNNTCITTGIIIAVILIPVVAFLFLGGYFVVIKPDNWLHLSSSPTPKSKSTATPTQNKTKSTQEPTPITTNWDGNYDAQMEKPNCDSSVELTSFQVVDNKVVNLWGNDGPIDSGGNASLTFNTGTTMKVDFDFGATNGKKFASGTWSTSKGCSGTFTAMKTW